MKRLRAAHIPGIVFDATVAVTLAIIASNVTVAMSIVLCRFAKRGLRAVGVL